MSDTLGIEKAVSSITAAAEELQDGLEDVRKFKSASKRLEENADANSKLIERLEAALGHMSGAASSLESASAALSEKGVGRFEKALDAGLDEVRESSRRIKAEVQAIETSLGKDMALIGDRFAKMTASVQSIQPALEKCEEAVKSCRREAHEALKSAVSQLSEKVEAQNVLIESMAREERAERQAAEFAAASRRRYFVALAVLLLAFQVVIVRFLMK